MTDENKHWVETELSAKKRIEQANFLLEKIKQESGMSFEVFVTPDLAQWLLEKVKRGDFIDPAETAYYLLQEAQELEPHKDLRREILKRKLEEAMKGPFYDGDEVMKKLREQMKEPIPETVIWEKIENQREFI